MFIPVCSLKDYSRIYYSAVGLACYAAAGLLLRAIPALSVPIPGRPTLVAFDIPRSLRSD